MNMDPGFEATRYLPGNTVDVEFNGEWLGAKVIGEKPGGLKVQFDEGTSSTVIPFIHVKARVRAAIAPVVEAPPAVEAPSSARKRSRGASLGEGDESQAHKKAPQGQPSSSNPPPKNRYLAALVDPLFSGPRDLAPSNLKVGERSAPKNEAPVKQGGAEAAPTIPSGAAAASSARAPHSPGAEHIAIEGELDLDMRITLQQKNPKLAGSKSYSRYERYKAASTVGGALSLGAQRGDIRNDFARGFIERLAADAPAVTPADGSSGAMISSDSAPESHSGAAEVMASGVDNSEAVPVQEARSPVLYVLDEDMTLDEAGSALRDVGNALKHFDGGHGEDGGGGGGAASANVDLGTADHKGLTDEGTQELSAAAAAADIAAPDVGVEGAIAATLEDDSLKAVKLTETFTAVAAACQLDPAAGSPVIPKASVDVPADADEPPASPGVTAALADPAHPIEPGASHDGEVISFCFESPCAADGSSLETSARWRADDAIDVVASAVLETGRIGAEVAEDAKTTANCRGFRDELKEKNWALQLFLREGRILTQIAECTL